MKLFIVIPCYNEEEVLPQTAAVISEKLNTLIASGTISNDSHIYFIDDGSKDATWQIIEQLHSQNKIFGGIKLAHNEGHQNALLCGLLTLRNKCDAIISMDADLQDDVNAIDEMIAKHKAGAEIVYGVRSARTTDTFFKRSTAESFYKVVDSLSDRKGNIVYNHADYRLMSRRAISVLAEYGEVNLFLRGIVPLIGFKTDIVYYERHERAAGESKYPLSKMLSFAWQGITSFSIKPLRLITWLGAAVFCVSIGMLIYFLIRHFTGHTIVGWSSLAVSLWAIGGLLQFSIGICGEYIGKIYLETKNRPRFVVDVLLDENE